VFVLARKTQSCEPFCDSWWTVWDDFTQSKSSQKPTLKKQPFSFNVKRNAFLAYSFFLPLKFCHPTFKYPGRIRSHCPQTPISSGRDDTTT
jgi:hypothetical protein